MIRAILLLCVVATAFADCTVRDFTADALGAIKTQTGCTAGTPLADGKACTFELNDNYKCNTLTTTCDGTCLKDPACRSTQCDAVAAPTGFSLEGACAGKINNAGTCKVTQDDANTFLGSVMMKDNAQVFTAGSATLTCNEGMWSGNWNTVKKQDCTRIAATTKHDVATGDLTFGSVQTVTPKAGYTCSTPTATCGYNGQLTSIMCERTKCAAATVPANTETAECAGADKTSGGATCTVTASTGFAFVIKTQTRTKNILTGDYSDWKSAYTTAATYDYVCNAGKNGGDSAWDEQAGGATDVLAIDTSVVANTCAALTDGTMYTVNTGSCAAAGAIGAACASTAKDTFTCEAATACAFNTEDGHFEYLAPKCKITDGCDAPKVDGATAPCEGGRIAKDAKCTYTNDDTNMYTCTNMGELTCGAAGAWSKVPSCTKSGTAKGSTSVTAYMYRQRVTTGAMTTAQDTALTAAAKTKVEATCGTPKDYTVSVSEPGVGGFMGAGIVDMSKPYMGLSEWSNAGRQVRIAVTGLTAAQATTLISSMKASNGVADYAAAVDKSVCEFSFTILDAESSNKVNYPRIYLDGKLDVPMMPAAAGSASITAASSWVMGVIATFLFLGLTR